MAKAKDSTLPPEAPQPPRDMQKSWEDVSVKFDYKGKSFKERIKGNLVLNDMSLEEIKDRLNKLPGKFAYWKALQVTVEREIEASQESYDIWYAGAYDAACDSFDKKPTEAALKNAILLNNTKDYRTKMGAIADLRETAARIGVITAAYNHQAWTLRSIAALTGQELSNIEIHGKGNLADL